jgi:hypothetical protein
MTDEIQARSGSFEAGTCGVIARLALEGSKMAVHGWPPYGNMRLVSKLAPEGVCILVVV